MGWLSTHPEIMHRVLITLGGSSVSWRTKRQTVVAKSSTEVEYKAMATTVNEVIWLRWLLGELEAL